MKNSMCFSLKPVYSAVLFALGGAALPSVYAASTGGCDNYAPTTGQTVTCTSSVIPAATTGVQTAMNNTSNNNVTVNVNAGTVLSFQGSPIGIGSASTVTNAGTLNSGTFFNGYGISFGANGRSGAGGNTVTNTVTGVIQTGGGNAAGIYVTSTLASSATNTIINAGSVTTTGANAPGIRLVNARNTDLISNTGTISSATTDGISVTGGANITNSGSITGAVNAVNFNNTTTNTNANTLTLQAGSVITGNLAFSTTKTAETLVFDGLNNNNFNNTVTGANIIKAVNGAAVTMSSGAVYALGAGQVNVDASSALTISGVIQDATTPTSLNKTGVGTLTLSGANTYTGGTTVSAGTLAGNATSLQGNILNNAAVIFNQNTAGTYAGVMSGTGSLTKTGSDTLTLNAANTYTGDTTVSAGTLNLTGSVASNTTVASGAMLQGGGTINGALINYGNVQPATGSTKSNLTVTGNYTGNNGTFTTNTYGPSTAVTADTLTIGGQAAGTTTIVVRDSGVLGQPTSGNGIQLVNSPNSTSTTAFQTGRIAAGAYEYKLVQTNGSWYLKTSNNSIPTAPPDPVVPPVGEPVTPQAGQRVETALYPALPTLARLYALNVVDSYDQRRGDLALLSDGSSNRKSGMAWGRLIGKIAKSDPSSASFGPMLSSRTYGIQLGLDALAAQHADGSQSFLGPFATFGQATGNVSSQSGATQTGSVSLTAYSLGLNGTHITPGGHYVDVLLQGTRFENVQSNSLVSTSLWTQGWGMTASLEGGYNVKLSQRLALVPQAQVIYNLNRLQTAQDAYSQISMPSDSSTLGRVGAKLSFTDDPKSSSASNLWARVSGLSMLSGANTQTQMSNLAGTNTTTFNTQAPTTWMAFDVGVNQRISGNHLVYLNAGYESALSTMYQSGYVKGGYTYRF